MEVSVIIRTLGRPQLAEALESLAHQTFRDFEAVIVDMSGGSVQSTLAGFHGRLPRLRHLNVGRRLSRSLALNYATQTASGDALTVLDDDNCYARTHLEILAEGLARTGANVVYTGVIRQTLTPDGRLLHVDTYPPRDFDYEQLLLANYIYTSSLAYRKIAWRRVGGFDERFPVYEDWDFLIRVAGVGRIEALEGCTAVSRNFTGHRGLSAHCFETRDLRRCRAGLIWTHRHAPRRELRDRRKLRQNEGRWLRRCGARARSFPFLLDWWWHCRQRVEKRPA